VVRSLDHVDEINRLAARSSGGLLAILERLTEAVATKDWQRKGVAVGDLADALRGVRAEADIRGRRRTLIQADMVKARAKGAATLVGHMPRVPFVEAAEDIVSREPRLAQGWLEVQRLYGTERGFALARSSDLAITGRVQDYIAAAIKAGASLPKSEAIIAGIGDWTSAYAAQVFQTNIASAYTAGRFAQVEDPDVAHAIGAFRYTTAGDIDVRDNHAAADGMIAAPGDPVWTKMRPPAGFNCRCGLDLMSWPELRRMGLVDRPGHVRTGRVPPGAFPDPGFKMGPLAA